MNMLESLDAIQEDNAARTLRDERLRKIEKALTDWKAECDKYPDDMSGNNDVGALITSILSES